MVSSARSTFYGFVGTLLLVTCQFCVFPSAAGAQSTLGNNAVCTSTQNTNCGLTTPTTAFIDASASANANRTDICLTIYNIFMGLRGNPSYPTLGAVIDARGFNPNTFGSPLGCTGTPWTQTGGSTAYAPSTILLPAGAISISSTWNLPANTHLIGQGDNPSSGTTIQASGFSGTMINFGSNCPCTGISVENLTLEGNPASTLNGIVNSGSGKWSYVNHVSLYQIVGTGLWVSTTAASNSGPYSNITFNTGANAGNSNTVCANINGTTNTQGIHGLSCTSGASTPSSAAVLLDASNNSIEDVTIAGFFDGIRVGANASAQSNVLVNILGTTAADPQVASPVNTVHITTGHTVTDLSIVAVSNNGNSGTYTLQDDLTGTQITDPSIALYALGKELDGGYSRFTTSKSAPTWATGNYSPDNTCIQGSLYSCTNTSNCGQKKLFGCPVPGGTWVGIM